MYGLALAFMCFYWGTPSTQPLEWLQLFFKISTERRLPLAQPHFPDVSFRCQTSSEWRWSEVAFTTCFPKAWLIHPSAQRHKNHRPISFPCCLMRHLPRACSSIICAARGKTATLAPRSAMLAGGSPPGADKSGVYFEHPIKEPWRSSGSTTVTVNVIRESAVAVQQPSPPSKTPNSTCPAHLWVTNHKSSAPLHVKWPHRGKCLTPRSPTPPSHLKWGPVGSDLQITSAPACTHLPTCHPPCWGMTITRCRGLIKVDDWHEQRFKGAINQRAPRPSEQPAAVGRTQQTVGCKKRWSFSSLNEMGGGVCFVLFYLIVAQSSALLIFLVHSSVHT